VDEVRHDSAYRMWRVLSTIGTPSADFVIMEMSPIGFCSRGQPGHAAERRGIYGIHLAPDGLGNVC